MLLYQFRILVDMQRRRSGEAFPSGTIPYIHTLLSPNEIGRAGINLPLLLQIFIIGIHVEQIRLIKSHRYTYRIGIGIIRLKTHTSGLGTILCRGEKKIREVIQNRGKGKKLKQRPLIRVYITIYIYY